MGTDHTYRYVNASNVYNKGKADGGTIRAKYFTWASYTNTQYIEFSLGSKPKSLVVISTEGDGGNYRVTYSNGSKWGTIKIALTVDSRATWITDTPYTLGVAVPYEASQASNSNVQFDITNSGFKFRSREGWALYFVFYTT